MKILQVNCVYKKGSTGKITYDLHRGLLAAGLESVVCYGRGEKTKEQFVHKTCPEWYSKLNNALSRITGIMYGGCFWSTKKLISIIQREHPDIVHLQCINGYFVNIYRLVQWLKKNHIKTVLTLHAEFMHTGGCGYALDCEQWRTGCTHCPRWREETGSVLRDATAVMHVRMCAAFQGFDKDLIVTSVSPWLMERANQSLVFSNKKHHVVLNGLDCDVFQACDVADLREKHGITKQKVVFHATPSFSLDVAHIKGGYYIKELAQRLLNKGSNTKIIVAGSYDETVKLPENMIMLGRVSDQRLLAQYYAMADVTVLTSKRETFSMVCAESLSCGTPVVGFQAGAPEGIAIPEFSKFVHYGDVDALESAVEEMLNQEKPRGLAQKAHKKYDKERMVCEYIALYKSMLQEDVP